ncbi:hypothetical protein HKCCE3408_16385 [Rhodobacterales bacterium HKCCE3408]|nr:hypothetical protein [Rhodobacterales bacterium HKCCE3408]
MTFETDTARRPALAALLDLLRISRGTPSDPGQMRQPPRGVRMTEARPGGIDPMTRAHLVSLGHGRR